MNVFVNGSAVETEAREIAGLLAQLNQPVETTLVELNGIALRRDEWLAKPLQEGDRLELLRIAAGG